MTSNPSPPASLSDRLKEIRERYLAQYPIAKDLDEAIRSVEQLTNNDCAGRFDYSLFNRCLRCGTMLAGTAQREAAC